MRQIRKKHIFVKITTGKWQLATGNWHVTTRIAVNYLTSSNTPDRTTVFPLKEAPSPIRKKINGLNLQNGPKSRINSLKLRREIGP